jgi:hypothetical protein
MTGKRKGEFLIFPHEKKLDIKLKVRSARMIIL